VKTTKTRYRMGDIVRLVPAEQGDHHHMATLREAETYKVLAAWASHGTDYVAITDDRGTTREFYAARFSLVGGPTLERRQISDAGAEDYDDALAAQEAYDAIQTKEDESYDDTEADATS